MKLVLPKRIMKWFFIVLINLPSKPHALAWGCRRRIGLSLKKDLTFT